MATCKYSLLEFDFNYCNCAVRFCGVGPVCYLGMSTNNRSDTPPILGNVGSNGTTISTTAITISPTAVAVVSNTSTLDKITPPAGVNHVFIVAILLVLVILLAILIYFYYRRRRRNKMGSTA